MTMTVPERSSARQPGPPRLDLVADSVLDLIGNTPMRRRQQPVAEPQRAHPRQAREAEPVRLGEGPHRQDDDRAGREAGPAPSRADHHRAVVGQHRHRPGGDRPAEGLSDQDPDADERVDRAPPDARGVRRRDHPDARRGGPQRRRRRAQKLAAEHPEWCFLYQYGNDANPQAHYEGTGPEICRDAPRSPTSSPVSARAAR